jgi:DDE superfamily endonuclease
MLIPIDRIAETTTNTEGKTIKLWYSGKHHEFGGNVQFLSNATGFPLWVPDIQPGHTHDLVAASAEGAVGALCATAAKGPPTLADKAYQGAGIGIHTPFNNPPDGDFPAVDNHGHNMLLTKPAGHSPIRPPAPQQ